MDYKAWWVTVLKYENTNIWIYVICIYKKIYTCKYWNTYRYIGNALYGLQGMMSDSVEVWEYKYLNIYNMHL
jgi:hypothetical protein